MSVRRALVLRRVMFAVAALVGALWAHAAGGARIEFSVLTPSAWILFVAVVAVCGPRPGRAFTARTPGASLAILAGWQVAAHGAMTAAPWAFGLCAHDAAAMLVAPDALVAHLLIAALLAVVVHHGDAALARAAGAVRAIARSLRWTPAAAGAPLASPPWNPLLAAPAGDVRVRGGRGPPV